MLEPAAEIADRPSELRLDAVTPTARRGGMVSLVEDEQTAGQKGSEPFAQRVSVNRVNEQVVRDQEATVRAPGIHAETALLPDLREVGAVEDREQQAEALFHLRLPLLQHRGGGSDNDGVDFLPEQQLARDEAGFDGLAEAGIVRDEQIDPWQPERLAERLHLVGVDLDSGTKRRLEEIRVRGGDAVPA